MDAFVEGENFNYISSIEVLALESLLSFAVTGEERAHSWCDGVLAELAPLGVRAVLRSMPMVSTCVRRVGTSRSRSRSRSG